MAETIRADRNASESGKTRARKNAEAAFKAIDGGKVDSQGPVAGNEDLEVDPEKIKKPARVLENLATAEDMQRAFAIFKNAERAYEAKQADLRQKKTEAKAVRDKALTDAADIMKSRGISKRMLTELYALSNRKEEEVQSDTKSWVWAVRALGIPVGTQLAFFDDAPNGFKGEDELLRRAEAQGRDAYADKKPDSANPFHPGSPPGQAWLKGFADAQAAVTKGMGPSG